MAPGSLRLEKRGISGGYLERENYAKDMGRTLREIPDIFWTVATRGAGR